jgi:hypothetical protein
MRLVSTVLALLAGALIAAGCGPVAPGNDGPPAVDPLRLATILPVPRGLADAVPAHEAPLPEVQEALAGRPDPEGVVRLRVAGFERGAIREWRAPGGGRLIAVVTTWGDGITATNVGGGAAELLLGEPGARAWTPRQAPGSRGVRIEEPGREQRALARAVGFNGLFLRSLGPVPEEALSRTMELLVTAAGGDLGSSAAPG